MDSSQFQHLIADLGGLTEDQRQIAAALLSGPGGLAEVTSLIEARFAAQAICPHCQSKHVGSWGRSCGLKRYRCRDCRKSFNALTGTPLARLQKRGAWKTYAQAVAQTAVKSVIEPIFEVMFHPSSHGFRPGRSCKDALREVARLIGEGHRYVVDADLKGYFDSIPHERLMERVEERIADGRVLDLLRGWLKQDIMDGMEQWTPTEGTPQGGVISPLLANVYLHPLDELMASHGYKMVRYADDFVVLCQNRAVRRAGRETFPTPIVESCQHF